MLTLYYRPMCPYCQHVLGEAEALGIHFNLKDITSDPVLSQELIAKGGKQQVPFLIDTERDIQMYESEDISTYLHEHYAGQSEVKTFGGLRVHSSPDVCDTCQ